MPLSIVIVGCGLGGLAAAHCLTNAGHQVTVFEADTTAGEIGAGLQVSPNVSRLLWKWGFRHELEQVAVRPSAATWRRYDTGELIGSISTKDIEEENGFPFYNVHRGDLYGILHRAVVHRAVIRTNSAVVLVKPGKGLDQEASQNPEECRPSIVLANGEEVYADLVIGADGVKSVTRQCLLQAFPDPPKPDSISSAYRAVVPTNKLVDDPLLKQFVENPEVTCWMGPGSNVVGYCISAKKEYNLVFSSSSSQEHFAQNVWSMPGDVEQLKRDFIQWEPRILRIIKLIPSALKWKIVDRPVFESWVHPSGSVVLLGDACHSILPYGGQGAAMAIEDGAVLGNLLSRVTSSEQVPSVLLAYESLRKGRCSRAHADARRNEVIFHLPDGPEQESRDSELRRTLLRHDTSEVETTERKAWAEKMKNRDQFGYDADEEVERWWKEHGR
ncbi:hypothetical protein JB92DRAFT_2689044 [Gautieria morchelliformis]|nr:hypothetical protein JB92DRAFT_2689044 [Gautieria morchelliformis]